MVGRLVSFWDGLFSGAMLVSGRVNPVPPPFFASKKHFQPPARPCNPNLRSAEPGGPVASVTYIPEAAGIPWDDWMYVIYLPILRECWIFVWSSVWYYFFRAGNISPIGSLWDIEIEWNRCFFFKHVWRISNTPKFGKKGCQLIHLFTNWRSVQSQDTTKWSQTSKLIWVWHRNIWDGNFLSKKKGIIHRMQDWIAQDQFQQFNNSHGLGKMMLFVL